MRSSLSREVRAGQRLTSSAVRVAALLATRGVPTVGRGAGHFAREAVEGAVNAVGEISGETTSFVRDTVIGVIEGTEQIVSVTAPAIKEVVSGAISGGREVSENVVEVGQSAVEGAIVGAAAVGIESDKAVGAAVEGAVGAMLDAGENLTDIARATVSGVATGIAAAGGDMPGAMRDSAGQLVAQAAQHERSPEEIAAMAGEVVNVVAEEAHRTADAPSEVDALVSLAAISALESAYRVSPFHAATVREELARSVAAARPSLAPEVRQQLSQVGERLATELPRTRGTWRGKALLVAARTLWGAGVTDLAASLAYFTVLSFFPLVAMIILAFAAVADTGTVRQVLNDLIVYYFPASAGLFQESVELLINNSAALGLIALVGVLIAANGLFLAANRSVNRVFGVNSTRSFRGNLADALISAALGIVLIISVSASAFLQLSIGFAGEKIQGPGEVSGILMVTLGLLLTASPAIVTGIIFAVLYHNLPRTPVEWKDAAFGGLIALLLFETGKHLFFWITGLAVQRDVIYGPVASAVVLLMWGYYAGVIFLYGAALVRVSGELRPRAAAPQETVVNTSPEETE